MQAVGPFYYELAGRKPVGRNCGLVPVPYQHGFPEEKDKTRLITREGGGVLKLSSPSDGSPVSGLAERGAVKKFSKSSARRLRIRLAEVLDSAFDAAVLLTMTYPAELHALLESWPVYKGHLRAYTAALLRRFPECSGFWKLEFQGNGRPHYHCIIFGLGFGRCPKRLKAFMSWHSRTWFRIVGSGLDKHMKAGTRAEYPKHREGARCYISSYSAKQEQACEGFTGRYWGQINSEAIPWAPEVTQELSEHQAVIVRRVLRRVVKAKVKAVSWKIALKGIKGVSALQVAYNRAGHLPGFKWPRRFRSRNNRSITYMGNASAMRDSLQRVLSQQTRSVFWRENQ